MTRASAGGIRRALLTVHARRRLIGGRGGGEYPDDAGAVGERLMSVPVGVRLAQ
jgi:hypothetical protein